MTANNAMADFPSGDIDKLMRTLERIPDEAREFRIPLPEVPRNFGFSSELIQKMVALGFPVAYLDDVAHFERTDLINLSLRVRTGTHYQAISRFWPRALRMLEGKDEVRYSLNYVATCPTPDHPLCTFSLVTPYEILQETVLPGGHSGKVFGAEIRLPGKWPELAQAALDIIDCIDVFELTWLPYALGADTEFMRATGLANCVGAAKILVAEGNKRNLEVRTSYGLLTSPPYAGMHYWAEIKVDDLWVPIDPIMIKAMLGWHLLDPSRWNTYRSLGGILCRLASTYMPVVMHDGDRVQASYPVKHLM